jgi:hypothetical protein
MKAFRFYTGPAQVHEVAETLLKHRAQKVYEGTQSVYFAVPAHLPETRHDAQDFVQRVYPEAGFQVEAPLHVEWQFP